ncbi:MAG: hypothetical protein ACRD1I_09280, partial [Terriglobia bacterium]
MDRRKFLGSLSALPAAAAAPRLLDGQEGAPVTDPVEKDTPPKAPTLALNHLGFRPNVGRKALVVRAESAKPPSEFLLRDIVVEKFRFTRPLTLTQGDLGPCLTADFSDLNR